MVSHRCIVPLQASQLKPQASGLRPQVYYRSVLLGEEAASKAA